MISRRTATTLNLTILLILGGLFLVAASESSPRQVPIGDFILGGTNQGEPDSTRIVPVYQGAANRQLGDPLRSQHAPEREMGIRPSHWRDDRRAH